MKITNDISYVGVNDHKVDLFEGMYVVPNGMSYNSYVVLDDKIAVFDSVDAHFGDEWLANVESVLGGKTPDYLVVQHMEPDHSANIVKFIDKYPTATVVSSQKAFQMMKTISGQSLPTEDWWFRTAVCLKRANTFSNLSPRPWCIGRKW